MIKMLKNLLKKIYLNRFDTLFVLGLIFLSFMHLVFALRTNQYFSVDDFSTLAYMRTHSFSDIIPEFYTQGDLYGFRRILGYIYVKVFFETFGVNALYYNLSNFIFHTINVFLLYLIAKKITKNVFASFFSAIVFNQLYLFYFSNIHEIILTTLSLSSIYTFFRWQDKTYISLTFLILALLTKEMAFSIPFIILALWLFYKYKIRRLRYHFLILLLYLGYQASFIMGDKALPKNQSYKLIEDPKTFLTNLVYYIKPIVLITYLLIPVVFKKIKSYSIFIVSIVALSPVLLFMNRREAYYLYLPLTYISLYLAVNLPKPKLKNLPIYIFIFFLLGGRGILPKIAWQEFPNWQKRSIEKLTQRIESEAGEASGDIYVGDLKLERDAKLLLRNDLVDLFSENDEVKEYNYKYDPEEEVLRIK